MARHCSFRIGGECDAMLFPASVEEVEAIARALAAAGEVPKAAPTGPVTTVVKDKNDPWANPERNKPCPCGSGLKYKKCHGKGL